MINEPKIIVFDSGLQIVATVEESDTLDALEKIKVHYPMEIMRLPVSMTHEAYSVRPCISFSDETMFEVNTNNIVSIAPLSANFREGYENMKEGFLNQPKALPPMDDFYEEELDEEPNWDSETIKEMVDELMGKKKRILH